MPLVLLRVGIKQGLDLLVGYCVALDGGELFLGRCVIEKNHVDRKSRLFELDSICGDLIAIGSNLIFAQNVAVPRDELLFIFAQPSPNWRC